MSGNISARTGSQTPSSKTTTPSSTPPAPPGETSSPSLKPSPPSECANGLTSVSRYDLWYQTALGDEPSARAGSFFECRNDPLVLRRMPRPGAHVGEAELL